MEEDRLVAISHGLLAFAHALERCPLRGVAHAIHGAVQELTKR